MNSKIDENENISDKTRGNTNEIADRAEKDFLSSLNILSWAKK